MAPPKRQKRAAAAPKAAEPAPVPAIVLSPETMKAITTVAEIVVEDRGEPIPERYLPAIDRIRLPADYEQAVALLADVVRLDVCREWVNQYEMLASYARMARDQDLLAKAQRVKLWALRRAGEVLKEIPSPSPGRPSAKNSTGAGIINSERDQAAEAAGFSRRQRVDAERIANVDAPQFEARVEAEKPPTVAEMARAGAKPSSTPRRERAETSPAADLLKLLRRFKADSDKIDVGAVFQALSEDGRDELASAFTPVEAWVGKATLTIRGAE
jgi:hypothetical protein